MKILLLLVIALGSIMSAAKVHANDELMPTDHLVIAQIQTGGAGSGTAAEEYVLIFNPTETDVIVTNWCIAYSSAADNLSFTSCLEPPDTATDVVLRAGGFVTFATLPFMAANPDFVPDVVLSGGMSASSGHLRLLDELSVEVDKVGWGSAVSPETIATEAHGAGEVISRDLSAEAIDTDNNQTDFSSQPIKAEIISGLYEQEIVTDLCLNLEGIQVVYPDGMLADTDSNCFVDMCPDLDDLQIEVPTGYEKLTESSPCTLIPLEDAVLFITELYPNAPSVDTGQEFIELYNPNETEVDLSGYTIQLGPSFTDAFTFENVLIEPGQYLTFSDDVTDITLPNSNGVALRLVAPAGNVVSETAVYNNAQDDESWALVENQWIWTSQITPAEANLPSLVSAVDEVAAVTSVLAPCPAGKFRNPATNRCKNIESAVSQLVPCEADEFRNPETNRCKKISSSSSSLSPCPEGQERNPETNRCRKTSVLATGADGGLPTVNDVAVQNTAGQVNWGVIFIALASTFGYIVYEWRSEIGRKITELRLSLGRS